MSHRKFGPEEIDEFLHLLDSELTRPLTVTLIAGGLGQPGTRPRKTV
jgi:hypothetical protein